MSDIAAKVDAAIDIDALVESARAVLRIPSESGDEASVGAAFAGLLESLGFDEVETDANSNVIGRIRGDGNGPSVMLNGHLDHVPVGDMEAPFSAAIVDGARWGEEDPAIYGRGACDMKSNMVAGAYAAAALKRAGVPLRGDGLLVADVGEEVDSPKGVKSVVERGVRADYGISLESTGLGVYLGHRGKLELDITVRGRTAHSSEPGNGVNAILGAVRIIEAIGEYGETLPGDELMGGATVAVTHVRSFPFNDTPVIPDRCVLRVDRRYVRGETPASVEAEVRAVAEGVMARAPAFRIEVAPFNHYPLMYVSPEEAIVEAALAARHEVLGGDAAPGAWRFGVNGTFMVEAGIPTVGIGPGNERWAHTPDEHVPIRDLEQVARVVARTLVRVCGAGDPT